MKSERVVAVELLSKLIDEKVSLKVLLSGNCLTRVNKPSLVKAICFGVCRFYIELEEIAQQLFKKKPKDTQVWCVILSGLYQLKYLDMPDYAVIQESVNCVKRLKKQWAQGFVNAILRNYCRKRDKNAIEVSEKMQYSHPKWFINELKQAWPNAWQTILDANNQHPPMVLRVNRQTMSCHDYLELLSCNKIQGKSHLFAKDAIELSQAIDVSALPLFYEGRVSVQDAAPQLAVDLLQLKRGLRVLDACCAPGGKTCHLLERETIELDAVDIDKKRLAQVIDNLRRLNLHANTICADVSDVASWWDERLYDRILLDAPCSATGVIRRHPDIKLLRTLDDVVAITQVQKHMLKSLWPILKPGGYLLYATCSVMPCENDRLIEEFLKQQVDASHVVIEAKWGLATKHGRQIFPSSQGMDGFYYSLLKKELPSYKL
jgi:16S rRNA (cytosine967-C5)-methyltransferase